MGYDVSGYLVVTHDTLVNSWNFGSSELDSSSVWHGNEHVVDVTADNVREIDPEGRFVMRSTLGILQVRADREMSWK